MLTKIKNNPEIAVIAVLAVGAVILLVWALSAHGEWREWCYSQGGHVVEDVNTGVTTSGDVTVSTTYFCLSEDGRILDIE
jgi:hypothetical protein